MNLDKRISQLEEIQNPKEKPTLKVFTQSVDGNISGMGLEFKNRSQYKRYAEEQGFNKGDRISSVLFVTMVNAKKENQ